MGFWPFWGREPTDVESASRIVKASTRNEVVRGKLTLYFKEPQTQAAADKAAELCGQVAEQIMREADSIDQLLGREPELASTIAARAPRGVPSLRAIELAALHVVADETLRSQRAGALSSAPRGAEPARAPGSGRPPSVLPEGAQFAAPPLAGNTPSSAPPRPFGAPSSAPPPKSVRSPPSSAALRLRGGALGGGRGSSPAIGAPPTVIATSLAPLLRDAAARLLIGCLRAHDLIIVRRVALDPSATEQLAALLPISEAPPGEFEASRAAEISRWHTALGSPVIGQLRAESCALSAHKARAALGAAQIAPGTVAEMIDALCRTAFPGLALSSAQITRYADHELHEQAAESVARILRHPNSKQLRIALGPLLDALQSDMEMISQIAKASLGGPS